jgi:hypothetical protein
VQHAITLEGQLADDLFCMLTRGGEIGQLRPIAVNDFLIVEQTSAWWKPFTS